MKRILAFLLGECVDTCSWRMFDSHQNSRIRHSRGSGHRGGLRDLSLSLAGSGSLCLAGCSLGLGSSALLLLGQLLGLLLLCKGLKTHTNTSVKMKNKHYLKHKAGASDSRFFEEDQGKAVFLIC